MLISSGWCREHGLSPKSWGAINNCGTVWEHPDSRPGKYTGSEPTITSVVVDESNSSNVDAVAWVPLHQLRPFLESGQILITVEVWGQMRAELPPPECPDFLKGRVLTLEESRLVATLRTLYFRAVERQRSRREVLRCLQLLRNVEIIPGNGTGLNGDPAESVRCRKTGKVRARWSDSREDMIRGLLVDLGAGYDWPAATEAADRTASRLAKRRCGPVRS